MKNLYLGLIIAVSAVGCKPQEEGSTSGLREIAASSVAKTFSSVDELRDSQFSKVFEYLKDPDSAADLGTSLTQVAMATGTSDRQHVNTEIAPGMTGTWGQIIMNKSSSGSLSLAGDEGWKEEMIFAKEGSGTNWGVSGPGNFIGSDNIVNHYWAASKLAGVTTFPEERTATNMKTTASYSVVNFSGELAETMRNQQEALAVKYVTTSPTGMTKTFRMFFDKEGRILAHDTMAQINWNGNVVDGHFSEVQYTYNGKISSNSATKPVASSHDDYDSQPM